MPDAPAPRLGIADVKPLLQQRAPELAQLLLPGGRREGNRWQGHDPAGGRDNFTIWISGPAAGAFRAWARDGKGDVIDLLIFLEQARDRKAALDWAKGWLGLEDAAPARVREIQAKRAELSEAAAKEEAEKRARQARYAKAIWLEAAPVEKGDAVWTYLEISRGIPLAWLWRRRPVRALRVHASLDYHWADGDPGGRRVTKHPAMLAPMSPVNGGPGGGLHRTYLAARGDGKARVPSAKKMHGAVSGCAIKLWRGETGLSEGEAIRKGARSPLVITEGIEDALSVAVAAPEYRVWAAGSLSLLAAMPWPACASELVIAADNDWDKPEALKLLDKAAGGLAAFGPVRIARAAGAGVKDMNDLLNARRRQT